MNIVVNSVKDDFKGQDAKLDKLETQFKILEQQVMRWKEEQDARAAALGIENPEMC